MVYSAIAGQLAWDVSPDPTVTGYRMYRSLGTSAFTAVGTTAANVATFTTTFDTNQVSRFYVVAYNASNIESLPSNIVTNTPNVTPPPTLVLFPPTVNPTSLAFGQIISGTSRFTNNTGAPLVITSGVLTARQPGASNASGPDDDWSPGIPAQTVPIGGIVNLNASWVVRADAPLGVWNAHLAVLLPSGYVDGPNTPFNVISGPPPAFVYYTFEAEGSGVVLVPPMAIFPDPLASSGNYIQTTGTNDIGTATYSINAQYAGSYIVWCRVIFMDGGTDSFYVSMDGVEDIFGMNGTVNTWSPNWQWTQVNSANGASLRIFNLTAGTHTLVFRGREIGSKLDKFIVTNNLNYDPNVGNVAPNPPPNVRVISIVP